MQNVFVLVFAGAQVKKLEDAKDLHVVALLDPWYYFDFEEKCGIWNELIVSYFRKLRPFLAWLIGHYTNIHTFGYRWYDKFRWNKLLKDETAFGNFPFKIYF